MNAKRGVDETSRDFFYQATSLPQTVDYRVDGAEAGLRYEAPALSMAITYTHRRFRNGEDALVWDNPYVGVVSYGKSATAPDNKAGTLSFVANARIGRRTRLNATLVRNEAKQDTPFLPYTTNASIDQAPVDETGLDANRESLSAAVNLVSRPTPRLRVSIAHAVADRRDRRRNILLTPVLGDLFATTPVYAAGYDYKRSKTDITLRYRVARHLRVASGYRNLDNRRTNLELRGNDEHLGWLEVTGETRRRVAGAGAIRPRRPGRCRVCGQYPEQFADAPLPSGGTSSQRMERRHPLRFGCNGIFNRPQCEPPRTRLPGIAAGLAARYQQLAGTHGHRVYAMAKPPPSRASTVCSRGSPKPQAAQPFRRGIGWYDVKDKVTTAGARFVGAGFSPSCPRFLGGLRPFRWNRRLRNRPRRRAIDLSGPDFPAIARWTCNCAMRGGPGQAWSCATTTSGIGPPTGPSMALARTQFATC